MIDSVTITNFRCLRRVVVPLRSMTVLIGKNDTGKTAFIDALARAPEGWGVQTGDIWADGTEGGPTITIEVHGEGSAYRGLDRIAWNRELALAHFDPIAKVQLPFGGVPLEGPASDEVESSRHVMNQAAGFVPAVLDYLNRFNRHQFDYFVASARGYIPGLKDIVVRAPSSAVRTAQLVVERDLRLAERVVSAGVKHILYFLALAFHPTRQR